MLQATLPLSDTKSYYRVWSDMVCSIGLSSSTYLSSCLITLVLFLLFPCCREPLFSMSCLEIYSFLLSAVQLKRCLIVLVVTSVNTTDVTNLLFVTLGSLHEQERLQFSQNHGDAGNGVNTFVKTCYILVNFTLRWRYRTGVHTHFTREHHDVTMLQICVLCVRS